MTFKRRQDLLRKTSPLLRKNYPMGRDDLLEDRPNLIELLALATIGDSPYEKNAMHAVRRMERDYVDWNEVRVTSAHELGELLKAYHLPPQRAVELKSLLQMIFLRENKLSTDLSSGDAFDAVKSYLQGYGEMPRRVSDMVLMLLGDHRDIPAGEPVMRFAVRVGLVEAESGDNALQLLFKKTLPAQELKPAHYAVCAHCREMCREKAPLCARCFIVTHCDYGTKHTAAAAGAK